ncbi:MAG: hypothetical protein KDK37_08375 [Leptospiraceae bacterium]|nr:hypothetical protein [Leptospiraceae bacterium]
MRFRLALHRLTEAEFHGDLFLDTGEDPVPTYGMSQNDLQQILAMNIKGFRLLVERLAFLEPNCFQYKLLRKKDHRRLYLTYTGPIAGNRGSVENGLDGEIFFSFRSEPWPEKLWFLVQAEP